MNYPMLTLTGLDAIGKQTQSALLKEVLRPNTCFSYPNYDHWSGQLIKAVLQKKSFRLFLEDEPGYEGFIHFEGTHGTESLQEKHPEIFQCLQAINRLSDMDRIRAARKQGFVIMDRYDIDALAYGTVDGCGREWLDSMQTLYEPSDLCLVFVGTPYGRPWEEPDQNERDREFQKRVESVFWSLYSDPSKLPFELEMVEVDRYRDLDPVTSITYVHQTVVRIVNQRLIDPQLQDPVVPLTRLQIDHHPALAKMKEYARTSAASTVRT